MPTSSDAPDLLSIEREAMAGHIDAYESFHRRRFETVLAEARRYCPSRDAAVLDIGRSVLTTRLLACYDDVSTLGFPLHEKSPRGIVDPGGREKTIRGHLDYDLNAAQTATPVATSERFDLVVFAEVIEHLHTAPELVLQVLGTLMKPGGYMIVQTPNAAALHKRLMLVAGYNPYERLRLDRENPGHFREYTRRELLAIARLVHLEVVSHRYKDYFGIDRKSWLYLYVAKALCLIVPSFARGQTLILRKPCGST